MNHFFKYSLLIVIYCASMPRMLFSMARLSSATQASLARSRKKIIASYDKTVLDIAGQRANYYSHLRSKPWAHIASIYIAQLKDEEQELLTRILTQAKSSQVAFNQHVAKVRQSFQAERNKVVQELPQKKLSSLTKNMIAAVLKSNGLVLKNLQIIHVADLSGDMCVVGNFLIVEEQNIKKRLSFIDNCPQSMILHEMQHILHDDVVTRYALHDFLSTQAARISFEVKDALCAQLNKFQEKRADMLAALSDLKYAYAMILYFEQYKTSGGGDHPTGAERLLYVQQIYHEMLSALKK